MDIIKSINDKLLYRYITLENNLSVLLISDPNTVVSSASLSVAVGSYHDGQVIGIAHFLEHMLFMGNEKYPDEDYYRKVIIKNGGSCNAFTAGEHTNFHFAVRPSAFLSCLDIFGQFFISPIFDNSAVDREKHAVDSEHSKNIQNDTWRDMRMLEIHTNPDERNPIKNFSTGTLETLDIPNIDDVVKKYYETHYSSHLMKLVVLGQESLDELEQNVRSIFTNVKNNANVQKIPENYPPIMTKTCLCKYVPIRNENTLSINIQLPRYKEHYLLKPIAFLSHLIGHEGPKSLFQFLKEKNLITSLSSGISESCGDYSIFNVTFILTDKGFRNKQYVHDTFCGYVYILKSRLLNKREHILELYNEKAIVMKNRFTFLPKKDPLAYVTSLSSLLCTETHIPVSVILSFQYAWIGFQKTQDIHIINTLVDMLTTNPCVILISSHIYTNNNSFQFQTEKWYGIQYFDTDVIRDENDVLPQHNTHVLGLIIDSFIDLNPFIVKKPKLLTPPGPNTKTPVALVDNAYWLFDTSFGVPEVIFGAYIITPNSLSDAQAYVTTLLYTLCINFVLNKHMYECAMAKYSISFIYTYDRFVILITGYPEKIQTVLNMIIECMKDCRIQDDNFDMIKAEFKKSQQNIKFAQPYVKVQQHNHKVHYSCFYDESDILAVIDNIKIMDILTCPGRIFKNSYTQICAQGNILQDDALQLATLIKINFERFSHKIPFLISTHVGYNMIAQQSENPNEKNNVIAVYYNIGHIATNVKNWNYLQTIIELLSMIMDKDFFNKLRTEQQLGYVVASHTTHIGTDENSYTQMVFLIQSHRFNCEHLYKCIREYTDITLKNTLDELQDDEIDIYKKTMIELLSKPDQTLAESFGRNYEILFVNKMDVKPVLLETVSKVTKQHLIDFYNEYFIKDVRSSVLTINII